MASYSKHRNKKKMLITYTIKYVRNTCIERLKPAGYKHGDSRLMTNDIELHQPDSDSYMYNDMVWYGRV